MTGAIILAAGKSSRMGAFKPMLSLGQESVSRRIVRTLKAGGADIVLVVTGRQAQELEDHLSDLDVCFVHNAVYETSQMLDSVKLGLSELAQTCDRILITPVDAPLFGTQTVKQLGAQQSEIVIPVCAGVDGHPVCIGQDAARQILSYEGEGGLRGAMQHAGFDILRLQVSDEGVLGDMDTPEDYRAMLEKLAQ